MEHQPELFRQLPIKLAASVVETLPYFDAYVLLQSRSSSDRTAILNGMKPLERIRLLDESSGASWQAMMDSLERIGPVDAVPIVPAIAPAVEAIIEACQMEKSFRTPEGGTVQVIARTDLRLEPGLIIAMLGPSGLFFVCFRA